MIVSEDAIVSSAHPQQSTSDLFKVQDMQGSRIRVLYQSAYFYNFPGQWHLASNYAPWTILCVKLQTNVSD